MELAAPIWGSLGGSSPQSLEGPQLLGGSLPQVGSHQCAQQQPNPCLCFPGEGDPGRAGMTQLQPCGRGLCAWVMGT